MVPRAFGSAVSADGSPLASVVSIVSFGGNNAMAVRGLSHLPWCVMPIGTTSYLLESSERKTDSAERSETSCSPERPPNTTPTRILLNVTPYFPPQKVHSIGIGGHSPPETGGVAAALRKRRR